MAYKMYLSGELMPVTPGRVTVKMKNRNETVTLISGDEITLLRGRGLSEVSFELLLPQYRYPFSLSHEPPEHYITLFSRLKEKKAPFQWILTRTRADGSAFYYTNMTVSLEEYTLTDDAAEGLDVRVSMKLRQYRMFSGRTARVGGDGALYMTGGTRETAGAPDGDVYTVKRGDSLWSIAKKQLGDGTRYKEIYELNRDRIKNPSLIYPGQTLSLPGGG